MRLLASSTGRLSGATAPLEAQEETHPHSHCYKSKHAEETESLGAHSVCGVGWGGAVRERDARRSIKIHSLPSKDTHNVAIQPHWYHPVL